jgi:hypothetical protein
MDAVELGAELFGRVPLLLLRVPIELVGPIRKQLFKILKVGPLLQGAPGARSGASACCGYALGGQTVSLPRSGSRTA